MLVGDKTSFFPVEKPSSFGWKNLAFVQSTGNLNDINSYLRLFQTSAVFLRKNFYAHCFIDTLENYISLYIKANINCRI